MRIISGQLDTYPTEEGYYLVKYFNKDENWLPSYGIFYYYPKNEDWPERQGFFYEMTCQPPMNIEGEIYGHKVFEAEWLPNLRSKDGKY